jgi:ubiquinone/menaquinone biosynthesis C-methylase UbiE
MHVTGTHHPQSATGHAVRGRLNAWLLRALEEYACRKYWHVKRELFGGLPRTVLEIGAGTGINFRHLSPGTHVVAVEPNVHMHAALRAAGVRHHVTLEVHAAVAESLPFPDARFEAVISSLVLCSVADPARALAEVRRVLRPGGRFWCVEHVAAPAGSALARVQRLVERPWRWVFEGCETQRDTARLLREAGFASVEVSPFTLRSAFLPIRAQIAAVALR